MRYGAWIRTATVLALVIPAAGLPLRTEGLSAGSSAGWSDTGVHRVNLADLPFATLVECGQCNPTICLGSAGHFAAAIGGGNSSEGSGWHPQTCMIGYCSAKHPEWPCYCTSFCNGICTEACAEAANPTECYEECYGVCFDQCMEEEPDTFSMTGLEDLWFGIRSGSVDPMEAAAAHRNVEFNVARSALQIIGCGGEVIAHIPLRNPNEVASGD
jgi:hypothetical protein